MKRLTTTIAAILFVAASTFAQVSFGDAGIFNQGWTFHLGDIENAESPEFDDSQWTRTDLPHDWSVKQHLSPDLASCTGYLPGGIGWYRKHFSGRMLTEENIFIFFEGVYNRSKVYINGHLLGERPSGYASFLYDITPYVNRNGNNVIAVRADHSRYADSRFYTGSGIYRNVWLIQAGKTHFAQWGVGYNATNVSDKQATLNVDAAIEGLGSQKCKLLLELKDKDGNTVAKTTANAAAKQTLSFKVKNPHRWDIKDPYLYTLEASILSGKNILDKTIINVGIRTLEFNPDKGFALNGKWIKVKGVCLHHDAGVLGAAVPDDVWERRLRNLQAIGTNAIRTSHNPQTPAFYDLCDKLGLLVMDEAFDEWEYAKKKWISGWNKGTPGFDGTDDFFNEWGERDLTDMVRRDRNHPSIFLWSIGNEVDYPNDPYSHPILDGNNFEFNQPMSGGYKPDAPSAMRIGMIAKKLAACVRAVDTSRPVTGALAGVVMSNQTEYPEAVDVVGYNYTESRYIKDHQTYPDRVIYGSENGSSYGSWKDVRDNEHIFGQFIWTGTDYLGESNAWPSRGFHTGMLDFGSFIKPTGHARAAMWCEEPVCYIGTGWSGQDTWNYEEGQMVPVVCYTNAAKARLLVNGVQVGETKNYDDETGAIRWSVPYKPGTIKAEAMDENGKVVAEYSIKTSLRPYALKVTSDKTDLSKAGSVAHVIVEIVDENGDFVNLADNEIRCTVQGPATLLGLEASNNTDMTDYTLNVRRAYHGRLLAYIQGKGGSGDITVSFTSPLLKGCSIKLESHNYVKLEDIHLSDPFILADQESGMYYMTGTGGFVWKSSDLMTWDGPMRVTMTNPRSWMGATPQIWAAELHKYNGKYYYFGTFTNNAIKIDEYRGNRIPRRACHVLTSDNPAGPYVPMADETYLPANQPTLDASLWVENGQPYLIFCHEWLQNWNGTVEAIRLKEDLSGTFGERKLLFRAFDSPWSKEKDEKGNVIPNKVTDGPYIFKTQTGKLGIIWTSWVYDEYTQGVAYSESGTLDGPWIQEKEPITPPNYGHGMIFKTFDGKLILCCHSHATTNGMTIRKPTLFLLDDSSDKIKVKGIYLP